MKQNDTFFAPQLYISPGVTDISFYTIAFGALELQRWANGDGSIHVAELSIKDNLFHLHETSGKADRFSPAKHAGTTVLIGLFVPDVDDCMKKALAAGAKEISPATSYEYGYRQGEIQDPFGHHWLIQMKI